MKKVIKNAIVVDVIRGVSYPGEILIEDGLIKEAGANVSAAPDAEVLDLGGAAVTPGLFDCHTHLTLSGTYGPEPATDGACALQAVGFLKELLAKGITYVRDVGGVNFVDIDLREAIRAGKIAGPDMYVSGQCICMTGGHSWLLRGVAYQVDGADEARKAARTMLRAGADGIKLIATGGVMTRGVEISSPQLTVEEMAAAIEEAHKVGAKTATHAQGNTGIKNALKAGIDSIEHGVFLDDWCVETMKAQGTYLVPTLSAPYWIDKNRDHVPDFIVRKNDIAIDAHKRSFKMALDAGITICMGTDSGTPFNAFDKAAYELVLMVEDGMTPMQSLQASTINSAELCGVKDSLGSITPGKKAHLAVFSGDPSKDINAVMDCLMTIKNGEVVCRK